MSGVYEKSAIVLPVDHLAEPESMKKPERDFPFDDGESRELRGLNWYQRQEWFEFRHSWMLLEKARISSTEFWAEEEKDA